jgi:Arc/MetJ-type ribon-helix-helix transcriptional regulator
MSKAKIAITLDSQMLVAVDGLIAAGRFTNRSEAMQMAVVELLAKEQRRRVLLREVTKLDVAEERALAEEGL